MLLKVTALVSILTTAFVGGLFWGPWLGLTISLRHLSPDVFLALTVRLSRNLGRIMTFLLPFSLLTPWGQCFGSPTRTSQLSSIAPWLPWGPTC